MFFSQNAEKSLLSDLNLFLINTYCWMKDNPERLFELVTDHFSHHSVSYYYKARETLKSESIHGAAAFIYLNRSCFNGLFRVNLKGRFNVPIGTKAFKLTELSEFVRWSIQLKTADLRHSDFEDIISLAEEGDFIFVDPPYTVKHNANGFIEYNEKIFGWNDQVRLAECLKAAKARGASFLLTNADHASVRTLYACEATATQARGSEMAGNSAHRSRTTELLVASSPALLAGRRLV